ncbi:MAG: methyltransferase domain-containing protein [Ferruginibacter sp.]
MSIYQTENSVEKSFDEDFIPEEQLQAQWSEFIEFKKVIAEISALQKRPVSILDIGIGSARVVKHLCGIAEIWNSIAAYHGIDNAAACLAISNKVIKDQNIGDKVSVSFLEANDLNTLDKKYDIIITTWFTPGNFYPDNFSFETYKESGNKLDLSKNEKFEKIFSAAYDLLNPGGEIVLGSCYLDNTRTRKKQELFYKKLGMNVITDAGDSFTATKEKFWSQRFTKEKIQNYFSFVPPENIIYTPLDTYDFALQVRIKKNF